jgi:hypothetical protein
MVRTREHQISRPDDHPPDPYARSLYMELLAANVRLSGQQGNTAQTQLSNKKDL